MVWWEDKSNDDDQSTPSRNATHEFQAGYSSCRAHWVLISHIYTWICDTGRRLEKNTLITSKGAVNIEVPTFTTPSSDRFIMGMPSYRVAESMINVHYVCKVGAVVVVVTVRHGGGMKVVGVVVEMSVCMSLTKIYVLTKVMRYGRGPGLVGYDAIAIAGWFLSKPIDCLRSDTRRGFGGITRLWN